MISEDIQWPYKDGILDRNMCQTIKEKQKTTNSMILS